MKSSLFLIISSFLISVACRDIPEVSPPPQEVPRNSCSIEPSRVCSAIEVAENYSIQLEAENFRKFKEVKVRVYKTVCELSGVKSPWWYQLDVTKKASNGGSKTIGQFYQPRQGTELQLCNHNSTVVFSSCSPILLDLPRQFTWKAKIRYRNQDILCFRLTLQLSGERNCRQKEVCVAVRDIPVSTPSDLPEGSGNDISETSQEEDPLLNIPEHAEAKDDDDEMLVDDEAKRVKEHVDKALEDDNKITVLAEKGCHVTHAFFARNNSPWLPDCDCEGYYKLVQCVDNRDGLQCWCSTPSGSEIFNSRKTLNCTDPESFEFNC